MEFFEEFEEFDFFFKVGSGWFGFGRSGLIFFFGACVAHQLSVTTGMLVLQRRVVRDGGFDCEPVLPLAFFEFVFERVVFGRSYIWEHA
jgi:hypothetical protein